MKQPARKKHRLGCILLEAQNIYMQAFKKPCLGKAVGVLFSVGTVWGGGHCRKKKEFIFCLNCCTGMCWIHWLMFSSPTSHGLHLSKTAVITWSESGSKYNHNMVAAALNSKWQFCDKRSVQHPRVFLCTNKIRSLKCIAKHAIWGRWTDWTSFVNAPFGFCFLGLR